MQQLRGLAAYGGLDKERHSADSAEWLLGFVATDLGDAILSWLDPRGPRRAGLAVERLDIPGAEFPGGRASLVPGRRVRCARSCQVHEAHQRCHRVHL